MKRIFISHSSKDKPFVRKLASDIERFGSSTWVDENEIKVGDSILDSIEHGLLTSNFAIIVISKNSMERPWVKAEFKALFNLELERKKKIILPVLIESTDVPLFLLDKKYADFRSDYEQGLNDLIESINESGSYSEYDFESIKCDVTIKLKDVKGEIADISKKQTLKAINKIEKFLDVSPSDGEVKNIKVEPGNIDKIWKQENATYIQTIFPEALNNGETITHNIYLTMTNSFINSREYWSHLQHYPSKNVTIKIIFPIHREPKLFELYEIRGIENNLMNNIEKRKNEKGNIEIFAEINNPRLLSKYTVNWEW